MLKRNSFLSELLAKSLVKIVKTTVALDCEKNYMYKKVDLIKWSINFDNFKLRRFEIRNFKSEK